MCTTVLGAFAVLGDTWGFPLWKIPLRAREEPQLGEKWRWRRSTTDERVHAFQVDDATGSFVQAACDHTVPGSKLKGTHTGTRCLSCLLIVGDQLMKQ